MGLVRFSMTAAAIPVAQNVIRELDARELRRVAARALKAGGRSCTEVEQRAGN